VWIKKNVRTRSIVLKKSKNLILVLIERFSVV